MERRTARWTLACFCGVGALLAGAPEAGALILKTTSQSEVDAFTAGLNFESFEQHDGAALGSYDAGQIIDPSTAFSSRDAATSPTFHSGGASPSDPEGNPGTPIAIVSPSAGISGDVVSGINVAAPLEINTLNPWNFGFMEVIFFPGNVERVGFWITHGSITLTLRDRQVSDLTTGDVTVTGDEGEFIGISREGTSDIAVAGVFAAGGGAAFTFDDFFYADSVPEPGGALLLAAGAAALGAVRVTRGRARG
jgi:hypothetical protein